MLSTQVRGSRGPRLRSTGGRRILFVGEQWSGSNAASVERALRRAGHVVAAVDTQMVRLGSNPPFALRVMARLGRRWLRDAMTRELLRVANSFPVDLLVVYKGSQLSRSALEAIRARGVYCINIWPDVSMTIHGSEILECLPLYDRILTTKSFGPKDLRARGITTPIEFVPDVYDPDLERTVEVHDADLEIMGCDAGFIGTWSSKKARYLRVLAEGAPEVRVRVWGNQWTDHQKSLGGLANSIEGRPVLGDVYALAIACSKVNIALLSEIRPGASSGDLTTSRTFEIPGCGGFMLHERTEEVLKFFDEGTEIACFRDEAELIAKVRYYLAHETERQLMARAAHARCVAQYSVDNLAAHIIRRYDEDTTVARQT